MNEHEQRLVTEDSLGFLVTYESRLVGAKEGDFTLYTLGKGSRAGRHALPEGRRFQDLDGHEPFATQEEALQGIGRVMTYPTLRMNSRRDCRIFEVFEVERVEVNEGYEVRNLVSDTALTPRKCVFALLDVDGRLLDQIRRDGTSIPVNNLGTSEPSTVRWWDPTQGRCEEIRRELDRSGILSRMVLLVPRTGHRVISTHFELRPVKVS